MARPKAKSSTRTDEAISYNHEGSTNVPLDLQELEIVNEEGKKIKVPAISEHFVEARHFVLYKPLPLFDSLEDSDSAVASASKEEWLQRMEYLQKDLHWLLKLPHHKFWSQAVYDDSLQQCLDCYLAYAPRDLDLDCQIDKEVLTVSQKVHKLVFFVFLRMSTYKEYKKNFISPEAFGEMIYENYLFDIPKLMDLCALYARKNSAILKKMISNIFNTQPHYVEDLEIVVPHLFVVFNLVEGELNLNQNHDEMGPAKIGEHSAIGISSIAMPVLLDVVYYVTDISCSVNAFIEIYPPSCHIFCKHEAITRVASFYDTVFPAIENELQVRESEETKKVVELFKHKVQLAKTVLVKMCRNLITACCVQPIVESQCNNRSDGEAIAFQHLEEYLGIFTEVVAHKHFISDYNKMFPFETDVEMLAETGLSFDPTRLDYIFSSISQYSDSNVCNGPLLYPNKVTQDSRKSYRHNAIEQPLVKDLQSLAATLTNGTLSAKNSEIDVSSSAATVPCGNDIDMESRIVAVLDVLPELGAGFVEECLKYYGFNAETVVDVLLQGALPESFQRLDRCLQRDPVQQDGKPPSMLSGRKNVYDNDEFDFFNRTDVDMERVHLGKKDKTPTTYQGLCDDKSDIAALLKEISLSSVYEEEEGGYPKEPDMYEDEYDDTYDSNMVGLVELQTEKELQSIRPFTTPRVLEKQKGSPDSQNTKDEDIEDEEEEEEQQPVQPKRDEFIPNPEVLREKAAQRRQAQAMARNRRPHSSRENQGQESQGRSQQQNRQHKEKHKSQVANHNRRRQAEYKRSRGMGALPPR